MKVYNIQWDIDIDEALERLSEITPQDGAKLLQVSEETYAAMTTEERNDYAESLFRHNPALLEECMGLPDEIVLPETLTEDEDIADWLSDTYGFCHKGFLRK